MSPLQLVIQAGTIDRDGEALVLDMGAGLDRLGDRRLTKLSAKRIEGVCTGLRTCEKMAQELSSDGEPDGCPKRPLI